MFEQEGCPGCLHMKKDVLSRADVQQFYRERFLNFSIDIWSAVPLRDFSGRERTEKSFSQVTGIKGTPTLAFYDLGGTEIVRLAGPVNDGAEFLLLGEFVASGAYKTRNLAGFRQQQPRKKGS